MPRLIALVIGLVGIATPWMASAKPTKLAVTRLEGDTGNKVGRAVQDALDGKQFTVIGPKETAKAIDKLGYSDDLDRQQMKELEAKLGATAIVSGKVEKEGAKKRVHLKLFVHGKKTSAFSVQFANTKSPAFRTKIHEQVASKLTDGEDDDDKPAKKDKKKRLADADDEQPVKKPKKRVGLDADDDPPKKSKKRDADDEPKKSKKLADAGDDPPKKSKKADADDDPPKKSKKADADDDSPKKSKKRTASRDADDDDEMSARASSAKPAFPGLRVDLGGSFGQRKLSYTASNAMTAPPTVSTGAPAGRISGEVYPLALSNPKSSLAGLGFTGEYEKVVGLTLAVPNTGTNVGVDQHHYSVGARYQFAVGTSAAVAVGLAYARRAYIFDRSPLMDPTALKAPDVNYKAARPEVAVRVPLSPTTAVFGGAGALLILGAGPIVEGGSYGSADAFGFEATAGLDYKLTDRIGVRVAGELSQINLTFKGTGTLAMQQGVTAAGDRTLDVVATVGMTY